MNETAVIQTITDTFHDVQLVTVGGATFFFYGLERMFPFATLVTEDDDYGANFRGKALGGDANAHAKAIVDKAAAIGVTVLAITDHNNVSGVPAFRAAAKGRGVHMFPGFVLLANRTNHSHSRPTMSEGVAQIAAPKMTHGQDQPAPCPHRGKSSMATG